MATFTGTNADESITTTFVSPTVTASGGALPSDADDTINAGGGVDTIESGGGVDTVTGGAGNDQASLGAGNDIFTWNPGDGSDVLDGGGDTDTLAFNGSSANEAFDISNNGGLTRLFRDVSADLSLAQIETINLNVLGGADTVAVHDLTGTATTKVNIDLAGTLGGSTGDGQADTVSVDGTNGDDVITATLATGDLVVDGLAAQVVVDDFEAIDTMRITALGGDDVVNVSSIPAGIINLILEGGTGEDIFIASDGGDRVIGGDGDDTALLGAGDDEFFWNPGDDNDVIEGQSGADTLAFNGANVSENVEIFANGGRVILFRDIAAVGMDLDDTETIEFKALGGVDKTLVHDLSGTDVTLVRVDLAATLGGSAGDAQVDTIIAEATTTGNDTATLSIQNGDMVLDGLASQLLVENFEATDVVQMAGLAGVDTLVVDGSDIVDQITVTPNVTNTRITGISPTPFTAETNGVERVVILGNGGDDIITAASGLSTIVELTIDGGAGDDTIIGGDGVDVLLGGDDDDFIDGQQGNDLGLLGAGNDTFQWDPGDENDTVEGQDGVDRLLFNGSGADENVDILPNGERVLFLRDTAAVTMDLNDVETIEFNALGGVDDVTVNDLTGTDVDLVRIDLAGSLGGTAGDAAADTVTAFATNSGDAITVTVGGGILAATGLPADVVIEHGEAANDRLTISGLGGNDTIDASAVSTGAVQLTLLGGVGDDTLEGGRGDDLLDGGDNSDTASYAGATSAVAVSLNLVAPQNTSGAGIDTLSFIENLAGSNFADTLSGDGGNNIISGGGGNDSLAGQAGNDTLAGESGTDTASYAAALAGVTVALSTTGAQDTLGDGIDTLSSIENLVGSNFADTLSGNGADNTITGRTGDDRLTGYSGSDTLNGDAGNDTLIGGGNDDTLNGGDDNDLLIGQGGNDALNGGSGSDTADYASAAAAVTVALSTAGAQNTVGDGIDTLTSVENLVGSSFQDTLTGSNGENVIAGGGNNDALAGLSGNDTLKGDAGNDALDGGIGADAMQGGDGNDSYVVDSSGDTVTESVGAGDDSVQSSVSFTLSANVEKLTLTGSAGTNGTGNNLVNTIVGNSGINLIDGGIGADIMQGGGSNDTYVVDSSGDQVIEAAGSGVDTVQSSVTYTLAANVEKLTLTGTAGTNGTGNALANTIIGNAGVNVLNGGLLGDNMQGGGGNDTYVVDNAGDVVVEGAAAGVDAVQSSVTFVLGANVDKLTLTGSAGTNGTGNASVNTIIGNSAPNVIDGGALNDNMQGGGGNDTYVVDNISDLAVEGANAGVDTVQSSASFTLGANVEKLTLTGSAAINGTGNALGNTIIGNSGVNRIDGDALNDTLTGAGGADDFVFDDGDGIDTVTDFQNGADQFDLTAVAGVNAIGDLTITDNGSTVTVNYGTGSFTIANLADPAALDAGDFLF